MSTHEWNDKFWGVELPNKAPAADAALAFVQGHWDVLGAGLNPEDKPEAPQAALDFLFEFEGENDGGIAPAIAEVIGTSGIYGVEDSDNVSFVGIYALTRFPWDEFPGNWAALTKEEIESKVAPVVAELYGECPEFMEHTLWFFG